MHFFKTIASNSIEINLNNNSKFISLNKEILKEDLSKALEHCVLKFEQLNTIEILECADIPFYHSALLLSEILNFRLKRKEKFDTIQKAFDNNPEIIYNSNSEIIIFLKLLEKEIKETKLLKNLKTNKNYQEFLIAAI